MLSVPALIALATMMIYLFFAVVVGITMTRKEYHIKMNVRVPNLGLDPIISFITFVIIVMFLTVININCMGRMGKDSNFCFYMSYVFAVLLVVLVATIIIKTLIHISTGDP